MSDTIQVDYQALLKVAQKFEEQHQKLHRLAHELTHTVQNLKRGGWISDAANDFYRDMDNVLLPRLNRLERALHSSALKTEEIGRIMRGGEEEATGSIKSVGGGISGGIAGAINGILNNTGGSGGLTGAVGGGIAGAINDIFGSGDSEGIGGAVGDLAADDNESGDPIGGSSTSTVGEAAQGAIGEAVSGGGFSGAVGAAAGGAINEAVSGGAADGASGGGSSGGGGGASSGGGGNNPLNTSGQGQAVRSMDTSTPTEAPANEVGGGTGSASAFGGAPADGE